MKISSVCFLLVLSLVGCGGGGGAGSQSGNARSINSSDYALPAAVPSVPDQANR